jgi:hypothetical protein
MQTRKQIKQKALEILKQPRPTIEQWIWFKHQCTGHRLAGVSDEIWITQKLD